MAAVDGYPITGEALAKKHRKHPRSLRAKLRAYPELVPGHRKGEHYAIDRDDERRIMAHPEIRGLPDQ